MAIKLIQVDVDRPLPVIINTEGYSGVWVLVRDHGAPIGYARLYNCGRDIGRETLAVEIVKQLGRALVHEELKRMLEPAAPQRDQYLPTISVLVCTRDRPESLRRTLDCLLELDYPDVEVLVVDNCPSDDRTKRLVAGYPFRYAVEPIPGHSWVRNRAIRESTGEVVVFLDDDMIVDPDWLRRIADKLSNPEVACVTGLVLPMELETDSQLLFEGPYGGFCCGFADKLFPPDYPWVAGLQGLCHDAGPFMAFRRSVFDKVGMFDPALGGAIGGGEDTDLLHRITRAGLTIAYSSRAVRFHRHRVDGAGLARQLRGYGCSYTALLTKCLLEHADIRRKVLRRMGVYYWNWGAKRILRRLLRRESMPMRFILAECGGALRGPFAYLRMRRRVRGQRLTVLQQSRIGIAQDLSSADTASR